MTDAEFNAYFCVLGSRPQLKLTIDHGPDEAEATKRVHEAIELARREKVRWRVARAAAKDLRAWRTEEMNLVAAEERKAQDD